jgi:hypothetical protein
MTTNPKTILPRAMGDLNAAMRDLDLNADQVNALLDEGKLIVFNIAVKETTRKNLRVLTRSIEHYRETDGKSPLLLEWPEIFKLILPHDKHFVRGLEIQRSLNCDQGHVGNLILAGLLGPLNKRPQRGPGGSPIVTRENFEKFLKGRLQ